MATKPKMSYRQMEYFAGIMEGLTVPQLAERLYYKAPSNHSHRTQLSIPGVYNLLRYCTKKVLFADNVANAIHILHTYYPEMIPKILKFSPVKQHEKRPKYLTKVRLTFDQKAVFVYSLDGKKTETISTDLRISPQTISFQKGIIKEALVANTFEHAVHLLHTEQPLLLDELKTEFPEIMN